MNFQTAASSVSNVVFERAAEVFALLGTSSRLRMVSLLWEQEMSVGELRSALGGSQPSVSQNLAMLYRSGLLTRRRKGANVFYCVNPSHSLLVCGAVSSILAPALSR